MKGRVGANAGGRALALGIGVVLAGAAWVVLRPRGEELHCFDPEAFPGTSAYRDSDVAREIAGLGSEHPWAGRYVRSDGYEWEEVCLAPTAGWLRWTGRDVGPPFESTPETGRLEVSGTTVRLERSGDATGGAGAALEFVRVAYGERRYLVDRPDAADFCSDAARGDEPRSQTTGRWLMRVDATSSPQGSVGPTDRPDLCP